MMMKLLLWIVTGVLPMIAEVVNSQALAEPDPNCLQYLPEALDCIDSNEKKRCDPLPIPPNSFGTPVDPDQGYLIENPRPGVYSVSDGQYWLMIFVGGLDQVQTRRRRLIFDEQGLSTFTRDGNTVKRSLKMSYYKKTIMKGMGTEKMHMDYYYKAKGGMPMMMMGSKKPRYPTPVPTEMEETSSGAVKVLIADFPQNMNISGALDEILLNRNGLMVDHVGEIMMMYSHDHLDHIGGAGPVYEHILATYPQDTVPILASQGTYDLVQERLKEDRWNTAKAPPPTIGFDHQHSLKMDANLILDLQVVSAHTEGRDVIIYLPREDDVPAILFFVDMAYAGWAPFYSAAIAADLEGLQSLFVKVLTEYDFVEGDYFNGGHLTKTGTRSDLELFQSLVNTAFAAAGAGFATTDPVPTLLAYDAFIPGSRAFGNNWFAFDVYIDLASRSCLKTLLTEFGCKLAGLDVMGYSMCHAIIIYYITET